MIIIISGIAYVKESLILENSGMDEEMRAEYEELYRLSTKEKRLRAYMRVASKRLDELELNSKKDAINIMGNLIVSNLLFMDMVSALTGDVNGKESIRVASDFISRMETLVSDDEYVEPYAEIGRHSLEDLLEMMKNG